jgi:glycopeptide antibiotics resistance protein
VLAGVDFEFGRALVVVWLLPVAAAIVALIAARRRSTRHVVVRLVQLVIAGYLIGVVAITLWPFEFDVDTRQILDRGNWTPFGGTLGFLISDNSLKVRVASRDFVANILLFAPLGVLLAAQQRRMYGVALVAVLLSGVAFALEVIQGLTVAGRTLDIDDAIAGSIGAVLASCAGGILRPLANRAHRGLPRGLPSSVG